jgi:hypothetical protein
LGQGQMALKGVRALVPRRTVRNLLLFQASARGHSSPRFVTTKCFFDGRSFLMLILLVKIFVGRINRALSISGRWPAMLQSLSKDIRECYLQAEQCRRWAQVAPTQSERADFLDMERRWLSLAHSYEFAERLSDFSRSMRKQKGSVHPRLSVS